VLQEEQLIILAVPNHVFMSIQTCPRTCKCFGGRSANLHSTRRRCTST